MRTGSCINNYNTYLNSQEKLELEDGLDEEEEEEESEEKEDNYIEII